MHIWLYTCYANKSYMDPNQPQNPTPQPAPQPGPAPVPSAQAADDFYGSATPTPQPVPNPQPLYQQPAAPAPQPAQAAPQPFDPNYLDYIAAPPPQQKFFSGSFGKIFFIMLTLLFFAVGIIVAMQGKDKTEDLQQIVVRIENMKKVVEKVQPYIKSGDLRGTTGDLMLWTTNAQREGESLLKTAKVKRTQYNKKMVASEAALGKELTQKFEDARLNANLDRVFASTMAGETDKLKVMLNTMGKRSQAQKIREFGKTAASNLANYQKSLADYNDDGIN